MRKIVLDFIAKLLFKSVKPSEIFDLVKDNDFVECLVKISSSYLIMPLIYTKLKSNGLLDLFPKDFVEFIKEINLLNKYRNEHLLNELDFFNQLFKKNNIDFVFLKGAALISHSYFEDISDRMLGDIDILVSKNDFKKSIKLLKELGYNSKNNHQFFNKIHFPRLVHKDRVFCVEIHEELVRHNQIKLLPPDKVLKNKIKSNREYPIPCEKDLLLHSIYNYQINDHGSLYCQHNFRNLYDSFRIIKKEKINTELLPKNKIINRYFIIASIYSENFIISSMNFGLSLYRQRFLLKNKNKTIWKIDSFLIKSFRVFLKKPWQFYIFVLDKEYRTYLFNKNKN